MIDTLTDAQAQEFRFIDGRNPEVMIAHVVTIACAVGRVARLPSGHEMALVSIAIGVEPPLWESAGTEVEETAKRRRCWQRRMASSWGLFGGILRNEVVEIFGDVGNLRKYSSDMSPLARKRPSRHKPGNDTRTPRNR